MSSNLKKIIITALATGGIVGGGFIAINGNCDYRLPLDDGESICITQEIKDLLDSELKANEGFGGIKFE